MTNVGPGKDDSYSDVRSDYEKNEVAVDYNSGFTGEVGHTSKFASTLSSAVLGEMDRKLPESHALSCTAAQVFCLGA